MYFMFIFIVPKSVCLCFLREFFSFFALLQNKFPLGDNKVEVEFEVDRKLFIFFF